MLIYKNANEAYTNTLKLIKETGSDFDNTKALFNHGFTILNPMDNVITDTERKWSNDYAEKEWQWYLSKNPNVIELSKTAKIWKNHMDSNGNVNSNYGAQINRSNQLNYMLSKLLEKINTRHAWLTIYDAKDNYKSPFTNNKLEKDTPCTLNIGFQFYNNKLNMTVLMRSNDIHFGFCNDQYCFSKLFELICYNLEIEMGTYYHWSANIHLYNKQ